MVAEGSMFEAEELLICEPAAWSVAATGMPMTCSDFDPTGNFIAYSNTPGRFTVVNAFDGSVVCDFKQQLTNHPITGLKFHQTDPNLIMATSKDGYMFLHNFKTDELAIGTRQHGSNILCMTVDSFGEQFAIGCADGTIRIHNLEDLQRTSACVKNSQRVGTGQTTNMYCLCFHPEDNNILLAAGMNDRIQFWDIRTGSSERYIAGPHIRGDAIDMLGNVIVTASAREKKQIEVWDYNSTKRITELSFDNMKCGAKQVLPNNLKIARNEMGFVVGGSGASVTQMYDFKATEFIGQSCELTASVSTAAISPFGSSIFFGGENGDAFCQMVRAKPGAII